MVCKSAVGIGLFVCCVSFAMLPGDSFLHMSTNVHKHPSRHTEPSRCSRPVRSFRHLYNPSRSLSLRPPSPRRPDMLGCRMSADTEGENKNKVQSEAAKEEEKKEGEEEKQETWLEGLQGLWHEMMDPPFSEDTGLAAMAVKYRLEIIQHTTEILQQSSNPELREWAVEEKALAQRELMPDLENKNMGYIWDYWRVRWERMGRSKRLRKSAPNIVGILNGAFVVLFLRYTIPRLLTMQTMGDLGEVSSMLGLPGRDELKKYLDYTDGLDWTTKFAAFTAIFTVEKIFLIGEFVPFGVILPTLSPILFGGVAAGAIVTATSSTLASSANFWIGRSYLTEQVKEFSLPNQPPIGDSMWFQAIYKRFDSSKFPDSVVPEGFKSMLLMRLAPLLPIPVDAHWYVAGTTPVKFIEFFCAHFLGTFKVALLDAYLGNLLLQSVKDTSAIENSAKNALIFETVVIIIVSVVVTNIATQIFTQILSEEGVSMDVMGPQATKNADEEKEKKNS